jgi:1-acyl-sn-glycerol-3-phosphate acyltransferase
MLPFKSGAKIVANKFGLKVQPVVILGSRQRLDSVKLTSTSGKVKVIYLEPVVASKDSEWFKDIEIRMNDVFAREIAQWEEE